MKLPLKNRRQAGRLSVGSQGLLVQAEVVMSMGRTAHFLQTLLMAAMLMLMAVIGGQPLFEGMGHFPSLAH